MSGSLDFPASPTNGQTFGQWQFDGTKWIGGGSSAACLPLAGGTLTGTLNLRTPSPAQQINSNNNYSGTSAANPAYAHLFQAATDTITDPNGFVLVGINDYCGGATMTGPRNPLVVKGQLTAPSGNTTQGTAIVAGTFQAFSTSSDNGTSSTPGGSVFGLNSVSAVYSGVSFWGQLVGYEADIVAQSGTSLSDKLGIQIVLSPGDAVRATHDDCAISFNAGEIMGAAGSSPGWGIGIAFGRSGGYWPFAADSVLLKSIPNRTGDVPLVAGTGIDWSNVTFTNYSLNLPGFTVDPVGRIQAPQFRCGTTGGPTWTQGTGAPTSTQPNASLYSRTDGTTGSRLYVSAGGGAWAAVAGV